MLQAAQNQIRMGRFKDAASTLRSSRSSLDPSCVNLYEVLEAETAVYLGDGSKATARATGLLRSLGQQDPLRAKCDFVLGTAYLQMGRTPEAIPHLQAAARLAGSLGDNELQCVAQLSLLRSLAKTTENGTLPTLLSEVRTNVLRSESPELFSLLHIACGHLEGRIGNLDQAQRHFDLAADLLLTSDNCYLKGALALDLCALSSIRVQLAKAIAHAHDALQSSSVSGHARVRHAAISNLGLLYLMIGSVAESERYLALASGLNSPFPEIRIGVLDALAQLNLLKEDNDACEAVLDTIDSLTAEGIQTDWQMLGVIETRARLLGRRRYWADATSVLDNGIRLAREKRDSLQGRLFCVLRAEALLEQHDRESFERDMALAAYELGSTPPLIVGEIERVFGKAASLANDLDEADRRFRRAALVFRVLDHACRLKDVEIDYRSVFGVEIEFTKTTLSHETPHKPTAPRPASAPTDMFRLVDLAATPELLAREAFDLMRRITGVSGVALLHCSLNANEVVSLYRWDKSAVARYLRNPVVYRCVDVEVSAGESYRLVFEAGASLESQGGCAGLSRLVLAAMALEKRNREMRQREPLWPVDLPADSTDGVFISPKMVELLGVARKVAVTDMPVLITGETGTGKEVVAEAVHRASKRAHESMLPFNCSTVPRDMLDAQLFGYRRGSFTGAQDNFPGILRGSAGGTLFLDEIAEMPTDLQPKLLRFLESHEIHPLGETRPSTVDVRVIAATNVDLEQLVASGRFREDLYYRLNVIRLRIPPLRERREEIPALSQRFLDQHSKDLRKAPPRLTEETMEYLLLYRWPGNVRQLSNELRRIAALTDADALVGPEHLSDEIRASRRTMPAEPAPVAGVLVRQDQPLDTAVAELERAFIIRALERSGGNFEEAAKALGLSRKGLYLKRQRLGIA